jgi:hypothetical protein
MSYWWECDCGLTKLSDPVAGTDWPDGVLRAVGPDCPECGCPMDFIGEDDGEGHVVEP